MVQFLRLGSPGAEHPAVRGDDQALYDLRSLTADIDGAFLADGGIARARASLRAGQLVQLDDPGDGTGERVGAPIVRPSAVLCIGQNYAAHAAESGAPPPATPILFFKHPNTIVGPFDELRVPRGSNKTDWEVELGVVISQAARYLDSPEQAMDYVAGYVVSHDVSERTFQLEHSGGQWSKGKCAETFNPLGPWLVPADEADPGALGIRSWVNGQERQNSTTSDLIFSVGYLVWHLSQYLVLDPGDVINTGTPEGVGMSGRFPYLSGGDVVELEIDGLGRQRQPVTKA